MIPSNSIPGHFDFMVRCSSLSHQEINHTSLLFLACLHFQYSTNTLYTMLTFTAIKKQLCGSVCFHYACLLLYRWQYRYITTVLPAFERNCFMVGVRFSLDCPSYMYSSTQKYFILVIFHWQDCLDQWWPTRGTRATSGMHMLPKWHTQSLYLNTVSQEFTIF